MKNLFIISNFLSKKVSKVYISTTSFGMKKKFNNNKKIFIEDNLNYNNTNTFKWKPIEKSSIDFLIKKISNYLI